MEYDYETIEKIDNKGNRLIVIRRYITTSSITRKLYELLYLSIINHDSYERKFMLNLDFDTWKSGGEFPREHFSYWMKHC